MLVTLGLLVSGQLPGYSQTCCSGGGAIIRKHRIYSFSSFGDAVTVVNDKLNGKNFVIVGNRADHFMVSFINDPGDGSTRSFSAVQGQYPVVNRRIRKVTRCPDRV